MKKNILIAALIFLGTLNSQAQLLRLGAKAGINYANLTRTKV